MRTTSLVLTLSLTGCCLPALGAEEVADPLPLGAAPANVPGPEGPWPVETPPAPSAAAEPDPEAPSRKVSGVVRACLNRFSDRALSSRDRYLSWVDAEQGPTGRERNVRGLYPVAGGTADCRRAVTEAAAAPPAMPELEQAAEAYAAALETLAPLLERANQYYQRETWRDDSMSGGRELHAPLMAAFSAFESAHETLTRHVDGVQDAARDARLVRLSTDPARRSEYLVERTMAQAATVVRLAQALRVEAGRYAVDDPQPLVAATLALETGADELAAHPSEGGGQARLRSAVEELVRASLALMRRVRDGTPFSRGERMTGADSWMTDASHGQVVHRYNQLIEAYNGLR